MSGQYNAFISYRHHPQDIRVAEEIHRALEHYHLPKALRQKGTRHLRLFRDKDELPITSNLSDTITRALANSEFLIVICSPHTCESQWVQREIQTFLGTHDRNHVLTVLAGGEPFETIPEILLSEDRVNPATGQMERVDLEPLSCDWRLPRRKARREELPRLAATLYHCRYDDLRQREKHYRTQRAMAGISLALALTLGFLGYMLHSNHQLRDANAEIQANYEESLKNQSIYLANASRLALEDGDRMRAIHLALEALPQPGQERPLVAQAQMALSKALGAYQTEEELQVLGVFPGQGLVQEFAVARDQQVLYLRDASETLTIWDTQSFRKLHTVPLSGGLITLFRTTQAGNLVLGGIDGFACCSPAGDILWTREAAKHGVLLEEDESLLMLERDNTLRLVAPDTGEELLDPVSLPEQEESFYTIYPNTYANRDCVLLCVPNGREREYGNLTEELLDLLLVDLQTGDLTLLDQEVEVLQGAVTDSRRNPIVLTSAGKGAMMNGAFMTGRFNMPCHDTLRCFDKDTHEVRWTLEFESYASGTTLQQVPGQELLVVRRGDLFLLVDLETGQLLKQCRTLSTPVMVAVEEERTVALLADGYLTGLDYVDFMSVSDKTTMDNLDYAIRGGGLHVCQRLGFQVTRYGRRSDSHGVPFEADPVEQTYNYHLRGNLLAMDNLNDVSLYDCSTGTRLWTCDTTGESVTLMGFSQDGKQLYGMDVGTVLWIWNTETGEHTCSDLALPGQYPSFSPDYARIWGNTLHLPGRFSGAGISTLSSIDLETGTIANCIVSEEISESLMILGGTAEQVLLWGRDSHNLYRVTPKTETVTLLEEQVEDLPYADDLGQGRYALGREGLLELRTWEGETLWTVDTGELTPVRFHWHEDRLYALCDDGTLYVYDQEGHPVQTIYNQLLHSFFDNLDWRYGYSRMDQITWQHTPDGKLLLNIFQAGNVINLEQGQTEAYLPNLMAYFPETETLLFSRSLGGTQGSELQIFPRYTLEQLQTMGWEALNDYRIPPEELAAYGITESVGE